MVTNTGNNDKSARRRKIIPRTVIFASMLIAFGVVQSGFSFWGELWQESIHGEVLQIAFGLVKPLHGLKLDPDPCLVHCVLC